MKHKNKLEMQLKYGDKVAVTLSLHSQVKLDFKIECLKNGVEMSESVEDFMINYIEISRKLNAEKETKNG